MKGLIGLDGKPLKSMQSTRAFKSARKYLNTGYSNGAASLTSESMKGWDWHGGSPDEDITVNLPIIRERCRDLVMNAPLVAGMINTVVNSVVGPGLVPEPTPDIDYLGWGPEEASRWKSSISRYWDLFAESKDCDALRMNNFYELTQLACRSSTESGDVFVTLPMIERRGVALDLCLNVIEADCICNPEDANASSWMVDGADILGGVELGEHGNVVAYWVRKHHPLAQRITVSQVRQSRPN